MPSLIARSLTVLSYRCTGNVVPRQQTPVTLNNASQRHRRRSNHAAIAHSWLAAFYRYRVPASVTRNDIVAPGDM